jgi:hypothetical protein
MARLIGLFCALLLWPRTLFAAQDDVVLVPTVLAVRETPGAPQTLRRPEPTDGRETMGLARRLDASLREAVQDLGLTLDVSERPSTSGSELTDDALVERATESWLVSPRLELEEGKLRVRILAIAPGSKVLLVRTQEIEPREIELRSMVMMRDLVLAGQKAPGEPRPEKPRGEDERAVVYHARSEGRAVLALNSAALGGYVGYSIQRASGSDDPRLTYPLIALGTGIGLGGSMIIADEWDVGLGDAWYLSAGAWWPAATGLLLAASYDVEPESDRYVYGLVGASTGITLATVALTFKGMGEGGALLAHSGGAFGLLLGGLSQLAYEGQTDETPTRGMGYGAGAGVLAAGLLATQIYVTPSRVLLIDLGASLGALTGAAAASPLIFVEEDVNESRTRAWLLSVAAGTVIGGGIAWWFTRPLDAAGRASERSVAVLPYAGVIGESVAPNGRSQPVFGAGLNGRF